MQDHDHEREEERGVAGLSHIYIYIFMRNKRALDFRGFESLSKFFFLQPCALSRFQVRSEMICLGYNYNFFVDLCSFCWLSSVPDMEKAGNFYALRMGQAGAPPMLLGFKLTRW